MILLLAWLVQTWCGTLEVIRTVPHSGYSEGLDYFQGYLWHALPQSILKIDPKDGTIVQTFKPASEYSESITWFQNKLWNVSFSDNKLYSGILNKKGALEFKKETEVSEAHAWGITHNKTHLLLTGHYSSKIYFWDPKTKKIVKTLNTKGKDLEDLAWDGTYIWTSSFTEHPATIFAIHPETGDVVDFHSLPQKNECPIIDGIAYDGTNLWITGKECPKLYLVKGPKKSNTK